MPKRAISVLVLLLGVGAAGLLTLEATGTTRQERPFTIAASLCSLRSSDV